MAALGTKYTDTLQVEQQPTQQMNALGDLASSPVQWLSLGCCRCEPSSTGEVSGVGATAFKHQCDIYMPPTIAAIADNTLVRIVNQAGELVVTGRAYGYHKYKRYAKFSL